MGFLNGIILLFVAFAAIPILIHLLNRHRVKTVYFSSLKYLKQLQKTRMRRLKIKQLLLLLLRMLIVLLIVFAFARPALQGGYTTGLGASAKTSAVILLDNSLSMSADTRDGSLFELGRDFAGRLIEAFVDGDEVFFATFNRELEPSTESFTLDFANAERAIRRSEQSYLATNPQAALVSTLDHLKKSGNLNREIYLLSDFSESGWDVLAGDALPGVSEGTRLYMVPITDPDPDNVKVTGIDLGRQLIYPGRPVEMVVQISNDSKRVSGVLASLFVDGARVSQADCDIDAYSSGQVVFRHTFQEPGLHHGFAELPDDAVSSDNRFNFSVNIPRRIRVLAVGENERDNLYVQLAIRPRIDTPAQIELKSIGMASLAGEDVFGYDCIVLSGITYMPEAAFSVLDNFTSSGGGLLIFMPPSGDAGFYGSRILKKRFFADIKGIGKTEGEGYYSLERLMVSHPVFSRYSQIEKDSLPDIRFREIPDLRPGTRTRVLGWFSSGSPGILEAEWGQGRAILLAADPKPGTNELVRHPLFVTFVNRAIEYLVSDMTRISERFHTGDIVERNISGLNPGVQVELIAPGGVRSYLTGDFSGKNARLSVPRVLIPGIYQIVAADSLVDQFAVNVLTAETTQRYLDPADIAGKLEKFDPVVLSAESSGFLDVIRQNRHGREIWKLVLLLSVGLLAVEMVLARSGESAPGQTQ